MNIKLKKKNTEGGESVKDFQTGKVQKFSRFLCAFKPMCTYRDGKYHQKKYFIMYAHIYTRTFYTNYTNNWTKLQGLVCLPFAVVFWCENITIIIWT